MQGARKRVLGTRQAKPDAHAVEAANVSRADAPPENGVDPAKREMTASDQSFLQRVLSTTDGVLTLTGSYCGPLLQQLPFQNRSRGVKAAQDPMEVRTLDLRVHSV